MPFKRIKTTTCYGLCALLLTASGLGWPVAASANTVDNTTENLTTHTVASQAAKTTSAAAPPATQAILLIQSSPLAGSQFHALPDVVARIRVGDALTLQREPDNPHDANAIRVLWQGQMLGYVPRRENKTVARAMDRGEPLVARVIALHPEETPWRRLRFEIGIRLAR